MNALLNGRRVNKALGKLMEISTKVMFFAFVVLEVLNSLLHLAIWSAAGDHALADWVNLLFTAILSLLWGWFSFRRMKLSFSLSIPAVYALIPVLFVILDDRYKSLDRTQLFFLVVVGFIFFFLVWVLIVVFGRHLARRLSRTMA
ncbi:hypothetical protein HNQ50_001450 [Silvimonas terrae]|uniref:Uncharacterized protein n=1 Tax=Silvimonas terrae TaxID=300266 RepID=A0A840RDX6_9NEIS|nr:hypothetical protein [Silvimonas terrae]MBB5190728.1 hypothetical protein [Silvimonas terrae]